MIDPYQHEPQKQVPVLTIAACTACGRRAKIPNGSGICVNCLLAGVKRPATVARQKRPEPCTDHICKGERELLTNHRPYMGDRTPDEYRALYREKRRAARAKLNHPCATAGCPNVTRATLCQSCAAVAREVRLAASGVRNRPRPARRPNP